MNMSCLSIYLDLFLSKVFCSFQWTSLELLLLNLFLSVLLLNGIVVLILFLDCLLLGFRNTINFLHIDFASCNLGTHFFFPPHSFKVNFLRFSTYRIVSSVNKNNFNSSFTTLMLFCFIAWIKSSYIILNETGRKDFFILGGKYSFTMKCDVSCEFL